VFNKVSGSFGVASRPQDPEPAPEPPPVDTGGGGGDGYPGNPNDGVNPRNPFGVEYLDPPVDPIGPIQNA
jgi:hypothetical protein